MSSRSGTSPADALLTHYGQRNGTCTTLFKHLHALGLYQSMYVIKDYVPSSLHAFLDVANSDSMPEKPKTGGVPFSGHASFVPSLPTSRSYRNKDVRLEENLDDDEQETITKKIMNKVAFTLSQ